MNVVVSLDHRFSRTPDGVVWSRFFMYSFWTRYLDVFDEVRVVARVRDVDSVPAFWEKAEGPNVSFIAVPHYHGPREFLSKKAEVQRVCQGAVGPRDAVIMRVASQVSSTIEPVLRRQGRPYGVEVVGDPYDVFAPGAVKHPLRPFFRWWYPRGLKRQCAHACAASYVTEEALQRRYPPAPGAFATHYSSIELNDSWLVDAPRPLQSKDEFTLLFVGTLDQLYKAPDVLIDAVALCAAQGLNLKLNIAGEGQFMAQLQAQAQSLGIAGRVNFLGQLRAGGAVQEQMDKADLFVLPSRQEGLPRVIIEAMARAMPAIGSTVGGIPELLPPEAIVQPGDREGLARKIGEFLRDPQRMARDSARNLENARGYREEILRERRIALYKHVRARTEAWLGENKNSA